MIDYKKDPYSENDPSKAICSHKDLNENVPPKGVSGCYDSKVGYIAAMLL